LDLSHNHKTLKIRLIPKEELEDLLLPRTTGPIVQYISERLETAFTFGEKRYWIDYHYEVDSDKDMIRANNSVSEEIARLILALRLFEEGCIRIVFEVWKGEHLGLQFSELKSLRSEERSYYIAESELSGLKDFLREYMDTAWDKKKTRTSLGIALNRYTDGFERNRLEDKIIDYMIGLEALYLSENPGELAYTLAHRLSILLSQDKKERQELFKKTRESYRLRSRIVHGQKYDLSAIQVWFVEDILRRSIKNFLKTAKPKWLELIF
jgi:hypothetical protein